MPDNRLISQKSSQCHQQMQQLMDPYTIQGFGPDIMGPDFGPSM